MTLSSAPPARHSSSTALDVPAQVRLVALDRLARVGDHVDLPRPAQDRLARLERLGRPGVGEPWGKPTTVETTIGVPSSSRPASSTIGGFTHTLARAKGLRTASISRRRSSSVIVGWSTAWSMVRRRRALGGHGFIVALGVPL